MPKLTLVSNATGQRISEGTKLCTCLGGRLYEFVEIVPGAGGRVARVKLKGENGQVYVKPPGMVNAKIVEVTE
jgi:hypothetical protein